MPLRIVKSTEAIPVDHPIFMIFGQPGIGKSSLGYSMRDPLTLDFDRGAHRAANRRDTLIIDAWSDVESLSVESLAPYASINVDTAGRCLDAIIADIAINDPKKAPGGTPTQQGWGVLKNRFRNWTGQLRGFGKDLLLIAHDKEDKDGDTRVVRPDIVGGSYGEVMKVSDFVGYLYMSGKDRVLDFNPTERWVGKNPANWPPFKLPSASKAQEFMAELFDLGRAALGKISEASASVAQQVQDGRIAIDTYTTAEELNRAIPEVKKSSPVLQPQISKLMMDRAAALKIEFDKTARVFIVPSSTTASAPVGAGAGLF